MIKRTAWMSKIRPENSSLGIKAKEMANYSVY